MFGVTKRMLAVGLAAGGLVSSAGLAAAALTQDPDVPLVRGATKVTICHATSSEQNPYVQIQVDDDSIVREGHGEHPGDIIPPFNYVEDDVTKEYPGKNWGAESEAIWLKGCEVPPTPQPIQPSVNCVDVNGKTFKAVFGYTNPNAGAVTIEVGTENKFDSGSVFGQPTTFLPGTESRRSRLPRSRTSPGRSTMAGNRAASRRQRRPCPAPTPPRRIRQSASSSPA